jgi:hypothetical protein
MVYNDVFEVIDVHEITSGTNHTKVPSGGRAQVVWIPIVSITVMPMCSRDIEQRCLRRLDLVSK